MFVKLGIVTNCLAKRLTNNDSFERLIGDFARNGFMHIEIRDGSYLRQSDIGATLQGLETAMQHYSNTEWQKLCVALHHHTPHALPGLRTQDRRPIKEFSRLLQINPRIVFSYAMAYPWMRRPEITAEDDARIIQALKLAYLLSPARARLRLVDLEVETPLDESTALSNLGRYQSLALECPVTLAVENSGLPPHVILNLAVQSKIYMAYDEANNFYQDGTTLADTEIFWKHVEAHQLISVHLKQKNHAGVRARLGEGFVDLPVLLNRLSDNAYEGDWLLEYRATDQPVQDAIHSRETLLTYQKQKGVTL
jgi:sugar phosphate isomerase/epimerase